jgi:pimeloyl-ACP methyl ester carboxylesterase
MLTPVLAGTGQITAGLAARRKVAAGSAGTTVADVSYASSIDALTLYAKVAYPSGSDLPVVAILHGFSQEVADFDTACYTRFANYGVFAVFVEMRGRGLSGGTEDSGGREIQDIYDAIQHVLATYPAETDAAQIHIVGYSGGGGNAYSALSRYPDTFNTGTSFFGISDYGHDVTDGWYQNGSNSSDQILMRAWIGDDPTTVPLNYHARANVLSITNFTGGHLWLFHDEDDSRVPIVNTTNIMAALDAVPLTNYDESITDALDSPRWLHDLPNAGEPVIQAEPTFMSPIAAKTHAAWTIAASGTLKVLGYLDTKRFKLWLGDGKSEFGTVVYNMTTRVFTITADTGAYTFVLTLKGQTPSTEITATVNGDDYIGTSDANGVVVLDVDPGDEITLTIQPDGTAGVDTVLRSFQPTTNLGTNSNLGAGESNAIVDIWRSAIKFNLSGIAAGSTIISATLSLYCHAEFSSNARTLRVYRLKRAWVETQATWNIYSTGNSWSTAGGFHSDDCEQTDIGSRAFSATETTGAFKDFTLTAASVQAMISGGSWTNNGFLVKADTETDDMYQFYSSDHSTAGNRPKLVIVYTEP